MARVDPRQQVVRTIAVPMQVLPAHPRLAADLTPPEGWLLGDELGQVLPPLTFHHQFRLQVRLDAGPLYQRPARQLSSSSPRHVSLQIMQHRRIQRLLIRMGHGQCLGHLSAGLLEHIISLIQLINSIRRHLMYISTQPSELIS